MSRLYEALKGASRFRGSREGDDRLWEALDLTAMEVPSAQNESQEPWEASSDAVNGNSEPSVMETDSPALRVQEIEPPEPEVALGTEVKAGLNRSTRLMPHAVTPGLVDYYRRLRTKILQQQEAKPFRTLVVTSALNLALSFSTLPSFKVLVIDGDLRRGTLGGWLGVSDDQPGLSNLFDGSARLEDVVLKSDQIPMHFMVRGKAQVPDLHPSHFAGHFQRLSKNFDLVLIDSPPVNLLADVQVLAANSDAVLLVARAFATTRKSLEKAAQELAPFRVIGAVLNAGVTQSSGRYYGYY
jgi:capsular exopolysaccharide synthesis family protein